MPQCRRLAFLSAAALLGFSAGAGAAETWTPELAFKVKRVGGARLSPDGQRVAFVVGTPQMEGEKSEWLSQLRVARSDGSGSFPLTQGEKSATSPAWSPDGKWIAFLSARGPAGARNGVWRIRVDGGEAEPVSDEKAAVSAFRYSPDGRWIAFVMADPGTDEEEKADKEKRDARVVDANLKMLGLYVVPVEKPAAGKRAARRLSPASVSVGNIGGGAELEWSPDSLSIAFSTQPTPHIDDWTKADVSVVDVETGAVRKIAATSAAESDPHFSRDGKQIAFSLSNDPPTWRRRARVALVPVGGGTPRLLADTPDGQPGIVGFAADGRIVVSEGYRTVNRLYALPPDGGAAAPLSPTDAMVDGPALDTSGTRVAFASQAATAAPEAFVSGLDAFAPVRVSQVQELPEVDLGRTEVVTWKAPDGKEIEGLLTYPAGYAAGARVPMLVVVHGGPAGVFTRAYTGGPAPYPIGGFAVRGYAVLRANVRGSSGYGFDFRNANFRDWGAGDYRDIMAGVDAMVARGVADPERLGVMGWSYGGYMTSWIITQTKRFKAASVGAGVTNLMSFTGTSDIPSFLPDYFGGEFWAPGGLELWRAHSAMFNVRGVTTPTLIQHGEADLRVPISQGYELYNALKRQGTTVKMVTYPRQPHGIQEPKLLLDAMKRNLDWFDRFVLGRPQIDERAVMEHVRALASDEFEGRLPGSKGEELTVRYLEEQFRKLGLAPGNPDGTYVQPVPMVGMTPQATRPLAFRKGDQVTELKWRDDYVAWSPRQLETSALEGSEVVFAGYGVQAPEFDWDDFKGADVTGKTIVVLVGDPPVPDPSDPAKLDPKLFGGRAMTYYGRWTYKYEKGAEKKAAGVLIVHETGPAGYGWPVVQGFGDERFSLRSADRNAGRCAIEGWVSLEQARKLFATAGRDFDQMKAAALRRDFRPVPLGVQASLAIRSAMRSVDSRNVVARLEGADPRRRDELVVYSAHWDHFGIGQPVNGDRIYNGALDNATGTAGLIEIARAFAEARPPRSVVFLAVTGEEQGLLGAKYYAEHPLYPLEKTLANINMDALSVYGRTRDVTVVGLGSSTLDDDLSAVAREQGRSVHADPEPEKGGYYRSDHFELAKQGVPALYAKGGVEVVGKPEGYGEKMRDAYLANRYHRPQDEITPEWDPAGLAEDLNLLAAVGQRVARAVGWPEWRPGTEFKAKRDEQLQRAATVKILKK
jgi:dipeptidyl aminopeptidase/acylaminoacyl peptidase/Zn-dependent M28 family amino/carboxypeptidase